ncbi:amidohydrolase [Consotaella aegiceratis]|uniref:amidohydrolase n=1 Tax=Consotaella aegiceratis TaxID=3097961 RepID=UPI002F415A9E
MALDHDDLAELTAWRHALHQRPDLSGEEEATARAVESFLAPTGPDRLLKDLGGHGLAAIYNGVESGPTVMLRAELDALPIHEIGDAPYRSQTDGKGHLCGHDGHMAILAGVARELARRRPGQGRVVLLFQPAEETGAGAAAVLTDPRFAEIAPDYAFALHNLPGLPLGEVALKDGPVNCASRGLRVDLSGRTAHASMPETGRSPMAAVAHLMPALTGLGVGGTLSDDFALVTVTHAVMGEPCFGVAPGHAEIWATLRTMRDARMSPLVETAEWVTRHLAETNGLDWSVSYHDVFRHCENDPDAVGHLRGALDAVGVPHKPGEPMRASEDFGRFRDVAKTAMLFLGAGTDHPSLHNPDYDFPDALIPVGARIFERVVRDLLG